LRMFGLRFRVLLMRSDHVLGMLIGGVGDSWSSRGDVGGSLGQGHDKGDG